MPVTRCTNENLEQTVADLERNARIISVQVVGGAAIIVTEARVMTRETRRAEIAAIAGQRRVDL